MILRYLVENKTIKLSEAQDLAQVSVNEAKKSFTLLSKLTLIEPVCKEYMLTAKGYSSLKSDIQYTQDKFLQYVRAKGRIIDYLEANEFITNQSIRELCGYTKQQARLTIDRMREEKNIYMEGRGKSAKYGLVKQ